MPVRQNEPGRSGSWSVLVVLDSTSWEYSSELLMSIHSTQLLASSHSGHSPSELEQLTASSALR